MAENYVKPHPVGHLAGRHPAGLVPGRLMPGCLVPGRLDLGQVLGRLVPGRLVAVGRLPGQVAGYVAGHGGHRPQQQHYQLSFFFNYQ